ncbi:MAG: prolipoprotein diacylglyceryl transferase [Trueperaceae bacterium]
MDPIMLQVGPIAVRWYGFLIAAGVLVGALWATRLAPKRGVDADKLLDAAPLLVIAGIIGARLFYVLTSPSAFFGPNGDPLDAFKVWQGGISIHGGILGVVLALWIYARIRKMDMWAALDVMSLVGALGIIGGRIGNFMNGTDTGGRPTDWPIGFTWPQAGTETFGSFGRIVFGEPLWLYAPPACAAVAPGGACKVHLTPLYGALIGVALIFVVLWALRRTKAPGFAFWQFILWYSLLRSIVEEPFRDNPLFWPVYLNESAGIGFFTLTQLVSIPIVLVALYLLFTMDPDSADRRERLAMRARGR